VGLQLCDITRQALDKRVLNSVPWLRQLLAVLLTTLAPMPPAAGPIHRVLLREASVIARPGSPGTAWRRHVSWDPCHLQPAQVTVTEVHTGEGLPAAELPAGDLVVTARAGWCEENVFFIAVVHIYCPRAQIAFCRASLCQRI
jgi:hypothetical protein